MKRIGLYLSTWTYGGMENVVKNIVTKNSKYFCFTIILYNVVEPYGFEEIKQYGVSIDIIGNHKKTLLKYSAEEKCLSNYLKTKSFDVIHFNINNSFGLRFSKVTRKYGIKSIMHSHNDSYGGHGFIKRLLSVGSKRYLSNVDLCLACSDSAGKFAFKKNYKVIFNGIDYNSFLFNDGFRNEIRNKYSIDGKEVLLGHIGHFNYQKNQMFLIDVLSKLDSKYKLMLIGSGEKKVEVIDRITTLGLNDRVFLVDPRDNISMFYSAFDLFLFPSIFEGFGIVSIEAQANGIFVLASNRVPNVVNISNEIDFLDLDSELWSNRIKELNIKRNNKEINHKYDINTIADIYRKIYEGL